MLRTSSLQNLLPGISEKLHHLTYFLILCVLSLMFLSPEIIGFLGLHKNMAFAC